MKAHRFTLPYLDQEGSYTLEEDIGKIILITFWASWCSACGVDLPKKEQLHQSIDPNVVKMLTINVKARERDMNAALTYKNKYLSQLALVDDGRFVYDQYQCNGVPTTVIVDRNGDIYSKFDDQSDFLQIVQSLGELLKEHA
ncbi:TlpA family protein disulfide reductase [Aquibacillus koreensis]|uniref:TlpA family protein disulfide reductase n=1 Tax=Aquibacillus koreensis TaxID=279446 RepID=A0A9X4AJG7_9BACI|nr:TlpA disulfide reductase family protein [Aquibacillus koreensis]MCT2535929.1 TlpA family protein disulfide reductase [Aquibacillus koreensis]MDC3420385.1 TlpA family protein disulfide reductase [Aquibacillus koreensis]